MSTWEVWLPEAGIPDTSCRQEEIRAPLADLAQIWPRLMGLPGREPAGFPVTGAAVTLVMVVLNSQGVSGGHTGETAVVVIFSGPETASGTLSGMGVPSGAMFSGCRTAQFFTSVALPSGPGVKVTSPLTGVFGRNGPWRPQGMPFAPFPQFQVPPRSTSTMAPPMLGSSMNSSPKAIGFSDLLVIVTLKVQGAPSLHVGDTPTFSISSGPVVALLAGLAPSPPSPG